MRVAIAAAGTGGHVRPALSVADALLRAGLARDDLVFFGGDRYEAAAVPDAGFSFEGFTLAKLDRTATLRHLRIPAVLRRAAAAMADRLRGGGIDVVLGMSGYVTVPAAMAARRAGVPLYLQEQNASPGLAARFAAPRARRTFLGLPGRAERLPRSAVVGNPLRQEFSRFERAALAAAGRDRYRVGAGSKVLGVLGGSLGARILNEAASGLASGWRGERLTIVHLSGPAAFSEMRARSEGAALPWRVLAAEDRMDLFYAAVDLVVCRAGAMTVSEIAATGTPALFVPLRRVGQHHNARALADLGGAGVLPEGQIDRLPGEIERLLDDEGGRRAMGEAAAAAGRPGAADAIAAAVLGGVGG